MYESQVIDTGIDLAAYGTLIFPEFIAVIVKW